MLLQFALFGQQRVHLFIFQRFGKARADLVETVEERLDPAQAFHNVAFDVPACIKVGFLGQIADGDALGGPGLAAKFGFQAGHDAQQSRLAGAVDPKDADFDAGQERERDMFENFAPAGKGLGQAFHHIDVLIGRHGALLGRL